MRSVLAVLATVGVVIGSAAVADDVGPGSTMTPRQAMKDCIEQQKSSNISLSKAEMKRVCKDKMRQQKATGDMPQQPATDAPRN